ncbi:52 kDa repressor of the inhibitor of the protein kinase-like [Acyrthosiphon pisum]|uniref:HAT C-terminal dimerisation domain-containing protein n=1 Tax=Acyrthosiphon pisum TaxID=7029 RepID=A0A8R2AY83_ACYPI|nr:52 kDa repressor of the inhibitor of the protein kinase-like [Acyrthosiphon pisum]|eukprot:XP_008178902.1 PREDICTED: 52 kDa repressor of the inhibitor of the protein kinase-like [Acyrthosiphon pisum]
MCESFLKFVPVDDVSGQSLANHIITELKGLNIEIKNLRGQGYDGAASMSGKLNGVAALIRKEYPSALYIHCSAHNLNLWVERYNSIETFNEFFPAIIYCLEEMITWKDIDTSSKANQLLLALQSSEFNVALSILNHIFQYTQSLCKYLQSKNIDLVVAVNHINLVKNQLSCIRENATTEFNKLFIDINKRLNDFELTIEMPRLAKRQKYRDNIPTKDPEEYFRITLFLPFLDSFVQQLNDRFVNHQNIISGFQMFVKSSEFDEEKLRELVEFYAKDVDDFDRVKSETILWNRYLTDSNKQYNSVIQILNECNPDLFPNIYKLLQILITLPITSCEAERSFSTLKRIKSYLRNSTSERRLNGLAALNIHYEVSVTPEEVISHLSSTKHRLDFIL